MLILLLLVLWVQDGPRVRIGEKEIPVQAKTRAGERDAGDTDFGRIQRGTGVLVAYPKDRYLHFYSWTSGAPVARKYDLAFIDSKGRVTEVTGLPTEKLPDKRPSWGISEIEGVTSSSEVRYALFLGPNQANRLGIRRGRTLTIELDAEIEPMPALEVGEKRIDLEIVAKEPERSRGMTHRTGFSKGDGMLFAFPDARNRPFWMYQMRIGIDVCYLDAEGTLLEIHSMRRMPNPADEPAARRSMVPTKVDAPYVLETAQGYMAAAGFKVGDRFKLPGAVTSLKPEKSPFEE